MEHLALGELLMGLLGGLAVFLFGMEQMTDALKSVSGAGLSKVLGKLTRNRFVATLTGAFVTAIIQSSSVTTVLVVGFVSAGLMTLQQSAGVIMGANIGTTITAQIIAFKITHYALALVAVGFGMTFVTRRKQWRLYGTVIMGLGLIFAGMGVMSDATRPLQNYQPFINAMARMDNPLLAILVATVFTSLVQSSSATTGIVIVLASRGFITLEAGIALAFGANIGTCITAVLAAIGKSTEAKQAAGLHLLFNVLGVLIWLPLIGVLAGFVQWISPAYPELEGAARLAAETPRQIANAHTAFNLANTCLLIWFTGPLARLVTLLVPRQPEMLPEAARPRYIQDVYLQTPGIALDSIRREVARLGGQIIQLGSDARQAVVGGTEDDLDAIVVRASDNQRLYDSINEYVRRLSAGDLSHPESRRLAALTSVANHVQNIEETIAVNFVDIGRERLARNVRFGATTVERIGELGEQVRGAIELAIRALDNPELARQVVATKPAIQRQATGLLEYLTTRLQSDDPNRAVLYRLETQTAEMLQRLYYFAKKIAKEVIREVEASIADPVLAEELSAGGAHRVNPQ
ncbi:MAG: Na/Pi cotransporter family protein [Pirellulaceae bacterium]|nr:Na/Pi cotransporter family protein [Pirellulaceae bacterium]